jgi:lysine 2,3-aminomutase
MFRENYITKDSDSLFDLSMQIQYAGSLTVDELLIQLLKENPHLHHLLASSGSVSDFLHHLKKWAEWRLEKRTKAKAYYHQTKPDKKLFAALSWNDLALLRILNYIDYTGTSYIDKNLRGAEVINEPFHLIYKDYHKQETGSTVDFYLDMIALFRQLHGLLKNHRPHRSEVERWMDNHPTGLEPHILERRAENKRRIILKIIDKIDSGVIDKPSFQFKKGMSHDDKIKQMEAWWNTSKFHLAFAFRDPETIREMTDDTLDEKTLHIMERAKDAGIPFFVNPYYLSLLNTHDDPAYTDAAIRQYIFYSHELIDEFGHIVAWEMEDIVEPGKPNAAGWILPTESNLHRRYPEVAILIPDTVGRACGGLCSSCQRMYDFQSGHLNFNLDKLSPKIKWNQKLELLMDYFEKDTQLRDILITGGDALMSSDKSLEKILDAVYDMAVRKKETNKDLPDGQKHAEMVRVRLGTRLPVYIPQRITPELIHVLKNFKDKATQIGIRQFVIQTHFESAMEITQEVQEAVRRLLQAGWIVTNQLVFTSAAARRGHAAKLRKALNDIGVVTYYTFTVKGYQENKNNYATISRAVQEQVEEKFIGSLPEGVDETIKSMPNDAPHMKDQIDKIRNQFNLPFLSTDRSVLNLPGVGKSLTFKTIGILADGRRIMEFDHDSTRRHSPIIHKMGKVIIIEPKTITEFLQQLSEWNEDVREYESVFGFSMGETEERVGIYEYPEYDFQVTKTLTNLEY